MNGKVKWFNTRKGYGFLIGEDGNEYFAHYSKICSGNKRFKYLVENRECTFDLADMEDGRKEAINIYEAEVQEDADNSL